MKAWQLTSKHVCVVWGNTSKENLDRIHRLQRKAARLILDRESKVVVVVLVEGGTYGSWRRPTS